MSPIAGNDFNLDQFEIQEASFEKRSSAPSSPVRGQFYFNTTDNKLKVCTNATGPVWEDVSQSGPAGRGAGIPFDLTAGSGSPGDGNFKLAADPVTGQVLMNIAKVDSDGADNSLWIGTIADSTSDNKGMIIQRKRDDESQVIIWSIDGPVNDNSGWIQVPVSFLVFAGSWAYGDTIDTQFIRNGDKGEDGESGEDGAPGEVANNDTRLQHWVRVVSTENLHEDDLVVDLEVDEIPLEAGDRVLVTWGTGSGIYVVQASGDAVEADDDLGNGAQVWVGNEGSVYGNTGWARLGNHAWGLNMGQGAVRAVPEGDATASPLVPHERGGTDHQLAIGMGIKINADNLEVNDDEELSVISGDSGLPDYTGYASGYRFETSYTYDEVTYTGETTLQLVNTPLPGPPRPFIGTVTPGAGPTGVDNTTTPGTAWTKTSWDQLQCEGGIVLGEDYGPGDTEPDSDMDPRFWHLAQLGHASWSAAPLMNAVAGQTFIRREISVELVPTDGDSDGPGTFVKRMVEISMSGPTASIYLISGSDDDVLPAGSTVWLGNIVYHTTPDP